MVKKYISSYVSRRDRLYDFDFRQIRKTTSDFNLNLIRAATEKPSNLKEIPFELKDLYLTLQKAIFDGREIKVIIKNSKKDESERGVR